MFGEIKSAVIVKLFKFLNKFQRKRKNFCAINSILIINAQGVGDMVIFTPVIEALGKKYPHAKITILTSAYGAEVLRNNKFVTEIIVTENVHRMSLKCYLSLIRRLRKEAYDCVIDTSFTCISMKQMVLPIATGTKIRIGFSRGGFSHLFPTYEVPWRKEHMIVMYSRLARPLNAHVVLRPKLYLTNEDKKWVKQVLIQMKRPIFVVHPICQGEDKKWLAENFAELIIWLAKKYNGTIIITGITKEKKDIESIQKIIDIQKKNAHIQTFLDLPLLRIAALLEHVNLLVSVDTGIVHIATAIKTPTLCLYGKTGQIFWKPYNKNQIVIQKHPCAEIGNNPDPSSVIIRLQKCPAHGDACIKEIFVDDVKRVIEKKILH